MSSVFVLACFSIWAASPSSPRALQATSGCEHGQNTRTETRRSARPATSVISRRDLKRRNKPPPSPLSCSEHNTHFMLQQYYNRQTTSDSSRPESANKNAMIELIVRLGQNLQLHGVSRKFRASTKSSHQTYFNSPSTLLQYLHSVELHYVNVGHSKKMAGPGTNYNRALV